MLYSTLFLRLYTKILEDDRVENGVNENAVQQAIGIMHDAYIGNPGNLSHETYLTADYNKLAHRCAYLYKYAPMHTALVYEAMSRALTENPQNFHMFQDLIHLKRPFKICSLGSGPGTDVIGVLVALYDKFSVFPCSAKLVDIMPEWERTFSSVVSKLRLEPDTFGILAKSVSVRYFDWSFIAADLQKEISKDLQVVIKSSNLITLVKFVSAAACKKTSEMIEKIFRTMKPGAMVLFIDNAGGGFQELITSAARKHHLAPIFGPLYHEPYVNETFYQVKFGYKRCYKTRVAVQLLLKINPLQYSTGMNLILQRSHPIQINTPQRHFLQHRYATKNILMRSRLQQSRQNDIFLPVPYDFDNGRHIVPFRNQSDFNLRGYNILPQNYFPYCA